MNLRDPKRAKSSFGIDEAVKRALKAWSSEHDPQLAHLALRREVLKLSPERRRELIERMAEIQLGQLHVLLVQCGRSAPTDA